MKLTRYIVNQIPDTALEKLETVINLLVIACPIAGLLASTTTTKLDDEVVKATAHFAQKIKFALANENSLNRKALIAATVDEFLERYL